MNSVNSPAVLTRYWSWILAGCMFIMASCHEARSSSGQEPFEGPAEMPVSEPAMIRSIGEIPAPEGFRRTTQSAGTFAHYLRQFPLDTTDNVVHLYDGREKSNQGAHYRILYLDVGDRDLQQCADAVMRLQAEFLFANGREADISFLFTNGDDVPFSKYAAGFRPTINGNEVTWHRVREEDHSHAALRKYMDLIFNYAGSYSLSKQLQKVDDFASIQAGDVLIQGGFPGHAVIVADVAVQEETGKKCFLLAQSYMPAQEVHILINPEDASFSPWYPLPSSEVIRTPEWTFITHDLMRFVNL